MFGRQSFAIARKGGIIPNDSLSSLGQCPRNLHTMHLFNMEGYAYQVLVTNLRGAPSRCGASITTDPGPNSLSASSRPRTRSTRFLCKISSAPRSSSNSCCRRTTCSRGSNGCVDGRAFNELPYSACGDNSFSPLARSQVKPGLLFAQAYPFPHFFRTRLRIHRSNRYKIERRKTIALRSFLG